MDFEMFLAALRNIVQTEPSDPRLHLKPVIIERQIQLHDEKADLFYCPITAVCKVQSGKDFPNTLWREAADELGLDQDNDAAWIVDASDGDYGDGHDAQVRASLLDALGLKESA